jgi:hypothetical protein
MGEAPGHVTTTVSILSFRTWPMLMSNASSSPRTSSGFWPAREPGWRRPKLRDRVEQGAQPLVGCVNAFIQLTGASAQTAAQLAEGLLGSLVTGGTMRPACRRRVWVPGGVGLWARRVVQGPRHAPAARRGAGARGPSHRTGWSRAEDGQPGGRIWWLQPERPVGTVGVEMLDVGPKDLLQVAAADEQQPVQALGTDGPHPALGVRVRCGRPDGRHQHRATLRADHVVEAAGELRVMVADKEAHLSSSLPEHQQQVAGLLGDPAAVWVGGHLAQMDPAGVQFDGEQHVEPSQPHRVDGEEVTRDDPGGLLTQERQVPFARRGAGSSRWRRSVARIVVAETRTPSRNSSPWMRW